MARVLVCTAQVPFTSGGAERHAEGLVRELAAFGHEAELARLPFKWYPRAEILTSALAWRLLDVSEADGKRVDLVIPMKFPSYLVRHENKVVWLIHQFRQAYDRFGTAESDLTASPEDTRWRELIAESDRTGLTEARKIFTNARNTADRLARFNGIEAEALYHPPPLAGRDRGRWRRPGETRSVGKKERRRRAFCGPRVRRRASRPLRNVRRGDLPARRRGLRLHRARSGSGEEARGDVHGFGWAAGVRHRRGERPRRRAGRGGSRRSNRGTSCGPAEVEGIRRKRL